MTTTVTLTPNEDGTWTWTFAGTDYQGYGEHATGTCKSKAATSRKLNAHLTSRLDAWLEAIEPTAKEISEVANHKYAQRNQDGSLKY
jgi:hypothetical protein